MKTTAIIFLMCINTIRYILADKMKLDITQKNAHKRFIFSSFSSYFLFVHLQNSDKANQLIH